MIVLVCGGRDYENERAIHRILDFVSPTMIVCGGAQGADNIAYRYALERNIPADVFHARWRIYGKKAGPIRNQKMLDEAKPDLVIAFPGGRGTNHMVKIARRDGYTVWPIEDETYKPKGEIRDRKK